MMAAVVRNKSKTLVLRMEALGVGSLSGEEWFRVLTIKLEVKW